MTGNTSAPWVELHDLPNFDADLRSKMQDIRHYNKPALTIDDDGWWHLGQILARHQRDLDEEAAIRAVTEALPGGSRKRVENRVLGPLRRAQVALRGELNEGALRDRLEKVSGDSSLAELIAQAIRIAEEAIGANASPASAFVDDATGSLEEHLRVWWDRRASARSGGGRASSNGAGVGPAYQQFLKLCFSVLSRPPGSAYDALITHRGRRKHNEQVWSRLADMLGRLRSNR